jgi:replicative DNA helicase
MFYKDRSKFDDRISPDKIIKEIILSKLEEKDGTYLDKQIFDNTGFNCIHFKDYFRIIQEKSTVRKCKRLSNNINEKIKSKLTGLEIIEYVQEETNNIVGNITS